MIALRLKRFTLTTLCALAGMLVLAATPAGAAKTRRILSTFGGASSSVVDPYPLGDPQGMAVDQETEDVYVADMGNHRVEKFSPTGQFLLAFGGNVGGPGANVCGGVVACTTGSEGSAPGELTSPQLIAVDNEPASPSFHDVYVGDTADQVISKFTPEGALVESWGTDGQLNGSTTELGSFAIEEGGLGGLGGIAVGPGGTLYVATIDQLSEIKGHHCFEFAPSSAFIIEFHEGQCRAEYPDGIGVNPAGDIFAPATNSDAELKEFDSLGNQVGTVWNESAMHSFGITALTIASSGDAYFATAQGKLEHDAFNGAGEVLESNGGTCGAFNCGENVSDSVETALAASGIAVASRSGDTLLANATEGRVYRFGPLVAGVRPETPQSEQALGVTVESAKLSGALNVGAEGETGVYEFLYAQSRTACEPGNTTPVGLVFGHRDEMVEASIGALLPNTAYTFCLRMRNGGGETATGAPVTFTTPVAAVRPTELGVTDLTASSATLTASVNPGGAVCSYTFEIARAGGAFVPVGEAGGMGVVPEGQQDVPVSVHTQSLQPASVYEFRVSISNSAGTAVSVPSSFSTQAAGGGLVLPDDRQWELVSPPDKHGALILGFTELGLGAKAAVGGDAMTFLTNSPTEDNSPGFSTDEQVFSVRGPGGWVSRDISPPHEHAAGVAVGQGSEYVAFSEDLSLALVQPHGRFEASLSAEASEQTPYLHRMFVNGDVEEPCLESCWRPLVTGKPGYSNVPAGTRFGEEEICDLGRPVCGPQFIDATPNLERVLLRSVAVLAANGEQNGHYEWERAGGRLTPNDHFPELRVSTSEDGAWQYFMSQSVLATGGVAGAPNMYVSHGGVTSLVAVLSSDDQWDWRGSGQPPEDQEKFNHLQARTSRLSPDGRWFAFMSDRELTGYNTHDALAGRPDEEVYLYHAPADLANEAGTLVCASCDPSGARPAGDEVGVLSSNRSLALGETDWSSGQWIAANLPGWTSWSLQNATYQSRYLSDSGRLFFDSGDALVPQDVNGNEDVYEYEPAGVGACSAESALYSSRSGGCVGLISSGQDPEESAFLDASGTGGDVFFMTSANLVAADYDTALDVYDARECTTASACYPAAPVVSPPCETGDSCKAAPTPQPAIYGEPSSETFSGAGNVAPGALTSPAAARSLPRAQRLARALKACHQKPRHRRQRVCERAARARFARRTHAMTAKKGRR